jgi:hypothetical protein
MPRDDPVTIATRPVKSKSKVSSPRVARPFSTQRGQSATGEDWKASAAGGMKQIQIFQNEIQAKWNKFQIQRNEIQIKNACFPSPNRAFSITYADPQGFFYLAPLCALKEAMGRSVACHSLSAAKRTIGNPCAAPV